jgi:hypothetical protein
MSHHRSKMFRVAKAETRREIPTERSWKERRKYEESKRNLSGQPE